MPSRLRVAPSLGSPVQPLSLSQVISLADAPQGYADFDKGASVKYLIDPHGMVKQARK